MNTLGSWIDQEALVGMARDIAPAAAEATPWFTECATPVTRLLADDFKLPEHFAPAPFPGPTATVAAPEQEKVRHLLGHIRQKAELSGLIPKAAPNISIPFTAPILDQLPQGTAAAVVVGQMAVPSRGHVPHFEVPLGPLTTRLRALTDWIRRQIDSADIFIIDAQGCPVSDREAAGEIVAGAVLLAEAVRRAAPHLPSAAEGAIYLDLQDERRLCVIDTVTKHGIFTLGLIVPEALAPRAADRLRRALRRTVEAESASLTLPPRERW